MTDELEVAAPSEVTTEAAEAPAVETQTEHSPDLETSVASKMADVFKDGDEEIVDAPAAEEKTAETPETKEPAATPEPAAKPPLAATPAAPVVPAAYERSLKAYGWTKEEIADAYKADPANFLRTAAKMHETRNEETRRLSDLGRLAKAQQPAPVAAPAAVEHTKFDIDALKKTYGKDEPFIKELERANTLFDSMNQVMPWLKESQARQRQAEMDTLGKQVDTFFTDKELEPYASAYGKASAELKPEQFANRQKVLETADLLIRGSKVTGKQMSLTDALTLAHDSVSGPIKTQAVRQKIVEQVKTRQAAISLKPGTRSSWPAPTGDRKTLEAKVGSSLKTIFA